MVIIEHKREFIDFKRLKEYYNGYANFRMIADNPTLLFTDSRIHYSFISRLCLAVHFPQYYSIAFEQMEERYHDSFGPYCLRIVSNKFRLIEDVMHVLMKLAKNYPLLHTLNIDTACLKSDPGIILNQISAFSNLTVVILEFNCIRIEGDIQVSLPCLTFLTATNKKIFACSHTDTVCPVSHILKSTHILRQIRLTNFSLRYDCFKNIIRSRLNSIDFHDVKLQWKKRNFIEFFKHQCLTDISFTSRYYGDIGDYYFIVAMMQNKNQRKKLKYLTFSLNSPHQYPFNKLKFMRLTKFNVHCYGLIDKHTELNLLHLLTQVHDHFSNRTNIIMELYIRGCHFDHGRIDSFLATMNSSKDKLSKTQRKIRKRLNSLRKIDTFYFDIL